LNECEEAYPNAIGMLSLAIMPTVGECELQLETA
jgi:hypothetical protein